MNARPFPDVITAFAVLYSIFIIITVIPSFFSISSIPVLVYYLFVPGFSIIQLIGEDYGLVQKLLFSVALSASVTLGLSSMRQTFPGVSLPFNVVLPVFTIAVTLYTHYHPKERVPI